MNDIEVVWHDLKAYQLAHKTFTDVVELNDAIHTAVSNLNRERIKARSVGQPAEFLLLRYLAVAGLCAGGQAPQPAGSTPPIPGDDGERRMHADRSREYRARGRG